MSDKSLTFHMSVAFKVPNSKNCREADEPFVVNTRK
jgi:hypothetical protein